MNKEHFRITLTENIAQKLKILSEEKGVVKSAIISMAIDNLFKEEENREK
jgi:metal-responsive CopG/Arc/MetJ family transcriptional regulator